jgi:hypothetical protein
MVSGGFYTDSLDGDDGASVSGGLEGEEEPVSPATSRAGAAAGTTRRRGLPTPPASPSTPSKGGTLQYCSPQLHAASLAPEVMHNINPVCCPRL